MAGIQDIKLGVKPLVRKSDSIKSIPNPKNISELRSFFGSINQYMKFVRNLSTLRSPLRPLLLKKISLPTERRSHEGFRRIKETENYLYGAEFEIVTDHKALLSSLNVIQSNKIMQSRLTRWVNRLLPFNFKIKHIPGKDIGFMDLLSRIPSGKALPTSHYDNEFVEATVKKIVDNLSVKIDCKKNNCTTNELYNPVDVNTITVDVNTSGLQ